MDIFIETRIFDAYLSKKKYEEKKGMTPQGFEPWTLRSGVSRNTTMLWSHVTCVHRVERHTLWGLEANLVIPTQDCSLVQNSYGCVTIMYARD